MTQKVNWDLIFYNLDNDTMNNVENYDETRHSETIRANIKTALLTHAGELTNPYKFIPFATKRTYQKLTYMPNHTSVFDHFKSPEWKAFIAFFEDRFTDWDLSALTEFLTDCESHLDLLDKHTIGLYMAVKNNHPTTFKAFLNQPLDEPVTNLGAVQIDFDTRFLPYTINVCQQLLITEQFENQEARISAQAFYEKHIVNNLSDLFTVLNPNTDPMNSRYKDFFDQSIGLAMRYFAHIALTESLALNDTPNQPTE